MSSLKKPQDIQYDPETNPENPLQYVSRDYTAIPLFLLQNDKDNTKTGAETDHHDSPLPPYENPPAYSHVQGNSWNVNKKKLTAIGLALLLTSLLGLLILAGPAGCM